MVGVITGLMGSGKSCLLNRLFFRPIPEVYTSTGVVEGARRGLLHHIGHLAPECQWKILSHDDICEFLAPLIRAGLDEADIVKVSSDILGPSSSTAIEPTEQLVQLTDESPTGKRLVTLVKAATKKAKIDLLHLAHMIDTGGQPELIALPHTQCQSCHYGS